jgi:hypothetical protein
MHITKHSELIKSMAATLNDLRQHLQYSLANYLTHARPWTHLANVSLFELVERIAAHHQKHAYAVSEFIVGLRGTVEPGQFPAGFTAYNDLSLDYLFATACRRSAQNRWASRSVRCRSRA